MLPEETIFILCLSAYIAWCAVGVISIGTLIYILIDHLVKKKKNKTVDF